MKQKKDAKDIREVVIKVIERTEGHRGATEIRIVSWIIDGKTHAPGLEKREKFKTEDGERSGKAKAFSLIDLRMIQDRWDEIMGAMQGRPLELRPRQTVDNGIPDPF